jgi:RNA polymerase sigma-70 factor, ECF subfamily
LEPVLGAGVPIDATRHFASQHMDDASIAAGIRSGDLQAFEVLFRALHAPLCEVADSYVRSQDVAEEIVQDLFFALWLRRRDININESIRGYLFKAVRNRSLHHVRHATVVRRIAEQFSQDAIDATMSAPHPRPDTIVEREEARQAIARAVQALPERSRLAFVLRWQYRMTHAEVAEAMGISVKGVEKLASIATRHMRAALGSRAEELDLS